MGRMLERDDVIVLFDGGCGFCSWWVRTAVRHERDSKMRFAPLDSDVGRALRERHGLGLGSLDSVVLIEGGRAYTESDAALRIVARFRSPWRWLRALGVVPRPLRDGVYRLIARHRRRLMGAGSCELPDELTRSRFVRSLDDLVP